MSFFQDNGISVHAFAPVWIGGKVQDGNLTSKLTGYSHQIRRVGGYWSASMSLALARPEAEEWFARGLGRDIRVYSSSGVLVWRGFVNQISLRTGSLSIDRGPLMDVVNELYVKYSTVRYDVINWGGQERITAAASNTDSQNLYGIMEGVLSAGEAADSEAEQIRDTQLSIAAWPPASQNLSVGGSGGEISLSIECLGYAHLLKKFYYLDAAGSGTQNLSQKIIDVVTSDPNNLFSADSSTVATNTFQVEEYEDDSRTGWTIIKELVAAGDSSDNRYNFRIDGQLRGIYEQAPTTTEYIYNLGSGDQQVRNPAGAVVQPWEVDAGKWLFVPDFLAGHNVPTDLYRDPRAIFIEQVTYRAPWTVSVSGDRFNPVDQQLERLGLGGLY